MIHTKKLRVTTPVSPETDLDALRWFTAESFYKRAADLNVEIIEYTEMEVDAKEIPSKTRAIFPNARWFRFEAISKYPEEVQELLNQRVGIQNRPPASDDVR